MDRKLKVEMIMMGLKDRMENLIINKTKATPQVEFSTNGDLKISGVSIPENPQKFYEPIFEWLNAFVQSNPKVIKLTFLMDYMNTSSTNIITKVLKSLSDFKSKGIALEVIWCYDEEDEEDMNVMGQDLSMLSAIPFTYLPVKIDD